MAFGTVFGVLLFVVTMVTVVLVPEGGEFMALLGQYFYGYTLSPAGAAVGFFWGFVSGFMAGWFLAFVRNVAITVTIFAFRTKAELSQTADFLDHIEGTTMTDQLTAAEQQTMEKTIARIHEKGWGIAFGLLLPSPCSQRRISSSSRRTGHRTASQPAPVVISPATA